MRDRTSPTPSIQPVLGCQKRWGVKITQIHVTALCDTALYLRWYGCILNLLPDAHVGPRTTTPIPTSPSEGKLYIKTGVSSPCSHCIPSGEVGGAGKSPGKPALPLHGEKWCGPLSTVPTTLQGGTMINRLRREKTKFGDVSWGHLTNNRAGCKCQAWLWGTVLSTSCFLVNFNKWNFFLKETVYLSVHNDINPLLPSDPTEYHWVRR